MRRRMALPEAAPPHPPPITTASPRPLPLEDLHRPPEPDLGGEGGEEVVRLGLTCSYGRSLGSSPCGCFLVGFEERRKAQRHVR